MPKQFIIAAISARGFALAAHALGFKVVTLDAFADADTRCVAEQCLQVNVTDEGVDEEDFKRKFEQLNLEDDCQFIYGSLFDANPALLVWVAERVKIAGNLPQTLQSSRSMEFFALLDSLAIKHPEVRLDLPGHDETWLLKRLKGSGGTHVKLAEASVEVSAVGDYFQRKIEGEPVSLLFLADGNSVKPVGFNQQLIAPTADKPYRFAGAVCNAELPLKAKQAFIVAAERLTSVMNLRGLNSLDAVLDGENLWILELNPRLSATFQLYPNLLMAHLQACNGELLDVPDNITSKAEYVLYSDKQLNIPADFSWPDWVADIPFAESECVKINEDAPICTVLADGENAVDTYQLLIERVKKLKGTLFYD